MKLKIALFSTIIAVCTHIYLAIEHFALTFGITAGDKLCNINSTFNCDAVAASGFSKLFGVPIALWGVSTNIILLGFLSLWAFHMTEDIKRAKHFSFVLSLFVALTSVIMATISSMLIGTYCLYCIIAYLTSFITFTLIFLEYKNDSKPGEAFQSLPLIFTSHKNYLYALIAIIPISFVLNFSFVNHYGANGLESVVRSEIISWSSAPLEQLDAKPSLTKGSKNPKMIISEFADFRCGHCKHAYPTIAAFANANKNDVQVRFYNFPLDGACNDVIQRSSGISCLFAKTVHCAAQNDQGWEAHNIIFDSQTDLSSSGSVQQATEKLTKMLGDKSINFADLKDCIESEETHNAILSQAAAGEKANVKGTPAIYVNNKKVFRGQLIPVLDGLLKEIKKSK